MSDHSTSFIPSDAGVFLDGILAHQPRSMWLVAGSMPASLFPMLADSIAIIRGRQQHSLVLASSMFTKRCQELLHRSSHPTPPLLDAGTLLEIEATDGQYWNTPRAVIVDMGDVRHELVRDALKNVKWGLVLCLDFVGDDYNLVDSLISDLYSIDEGVAAAGFGSVFESLRKPSLAVETKQWRDFEAGTGGRAEDALYHLSSFERAYFDKLKAALEEVKDSAFRQNFWSMATSSVYALEQRLLYEISSAGLQSKSRRSFKLAMPKASEVDRYRVDLQLTRPYHQWSDPEKALSFFTELLHAADGMSDDSKLVTLSSIVEHELGFGRNVCVFTSFDETATFLKLAASDRMWFNAASIKMSDPDDERSYTLSRFRDRGGLLVAASGTTVGYDLGEVNIVVSYDIPLSKREVNYRTLSLRTSNGVGTRWLALSSDYTN